MIRVGVSALRSDLSKWLQRAKKGEVVVITERGRAIARMGPLREENKLQKLIDAGIARPPTRPKRSLPRKGLPVKGSVADLLIEDRLR